jgi:putative DNA primase/helicase
MSKVTDEVLEAIRPEIQLYRTPEKDVFVAYQSDWGHEVVGTKSLRFRQWLTTWVLHRFGVVVNKHACMEVAHALDSLAMFDTSLEERHVYTRVGWHEGSKTLYINLANDRQQVVRIRAGEEPTVVEQGDVPLVFHHADKALYLPLPQAPAEGETLDAVMQSILPPKTSRQQQVLLTAWLLGALHRTGPYPILALGGEPGSAKSFTCRLLRRVVDPAKPELIGGVTDMRNLAVAARHNYVLGFDNQSHLDKKQSDCLCRLATGSGIARRSLYTDEDLHAMDVKRPVLLNGIGELVTEADLLDRSIQLHLARLEDSDRKAETELWERFNAHLPVLLWYLYRAVAEALGQMGKVKLPEDCRPRMVDFACFVVGAESALGWEPGTFLKAYEESREEAMEQAITASFPAQALIRWMQGRERAHRATGTPVAWRGTARRWNSRPNWKPSCPTFPRSRMTPAGRGRQTCSAAISKRPLRRSGGWDWTWRCVSRPRRACTSPTSLPVAPRPGRRSRRSPGAASQTSVVMVRRRASGRHTPATTP